MAGKQDITHHLRRHQENIIAHVQKHKKKYLFGSGVAFGMLLIKVIIILGAFFGINMLLQKLNVSDQKIETYKHIAVFNKIDDFNHMKFEEMKAMNSGEKKALDEGFLTLDRAYHEARNINEKYQAAKKIVEYAIKGQEVLRKIGLAKPEDIRYFNELVYEFYQIR